MNRKRDKFIALAESRINKTLKSIELIGNLSNKNNYEYTSQDIDKIFKHLDKALSDCRSRFNEQLKNNQSKTFKL